MSQTSVSFIESARVGRHLTKTEIIFLFTLKDKGLALDYGFILSLLSVAKYGRTSHTVLSATKLLRLSS
jgi:hypothetical protein